MNKGDVWDLPCLTHGMSRSETNLVPRSIIVYLCCIFTQKDIIRRRTLSIPD